MPKIERLFTLEITPERFVEACNDVELNEVYVLASARLRRMEAAAELQKDGTIKTYSRNAKTNNQINCQIGAAGKLQNP